MAKIARRGVMLEESVFNYNNFNAYLSNPSCWNLRFIESKREQGDDVNALSDKVKECINTILTEERFIKYVSYTLRGKPHDSPDSIECRKSYYLYWKLGFLCTEYWGMRDIRDISYFQLSYRELIKVKRDYFFNNSNITPLNEKLAISKWDVYYFFRDVCESMIKSYDNNKNYII